MTKLISAIPLILISCLAYAAKLEEAASAPPAEGVSVVVVWLFLIGFAALIVGFFAYMWWAEKKKKAD